MSRRPEQVLAWLRTRPSLAEVQAAYPAEWERVRRRVESLVAAGDEDAVTQFLAATARPPVPTQGRRPPESEIVAAQVRRYLAVTALDQAYLAATTGVTGGTIRLGLVGGWALQKVLFRRRLERRPASSLAFRLVWPVVGGRNRRALMPLVRQQGIYCFYSRALVRRLAAEIGDRRCVEIAAGDGTLSRFLAAAGADVVATDDHSWSDAVDYPADVVRESATKALRTRRPEVVVCSWPPPGNDFEKHVFATPEVQTYVVVTTRHEASAGDWAAYRAQREFTLVDDVRLGRLVLPPVVDGAVLVFRRRASHGAG